MAQPTPSLPAAVRGALCGLGLLASADAASAQSMTASSSAFNGGWGRANGQENQSVAVSMVGRDASGNREIVDGIMQTGAATVQSRAAASGSASSGYAGGVGGGGGALAVGNSLTVVTQGDYNTVIVNSTQVNTGDVTAYAGVGGGVGE